MNHKITNSAGGVVLNINKDVLIVNQNYDSWSLPKGHIDPGETAFEAAKREIYEESGIKDLKYIKDLGQYERYRIALDGSDDNGELKKICLYLFTTKQMELKPIDPMNPEARWGSVDEVYNLLTHQIDKDYFLSVSHLWSKI
jgi:8-oxo-dGTP pyrophosphatase MutT (NUDIX family)